MRCMKKAKENWIGEHCSEIEENLRKNNRKSAYQLVKDLTTVEQDLLQRPLKFLPNGVEMIVQQMYVEQANEKTDR